MSENSIIINSAICDTRSMKAEDYNNCSRITINSEVVIVNPRSRELLASLPVTMSAAQVIELDIEDTTLINQFTVNGEYVITPETSFPSGTLLTVNGTLMIRPGTENVLSSLLYILVNGSVTYPENLAPYIVRMSVTGNVRVEPAGYTMLDDVFIMDRYFHLRAKQDARYYAKDRVVIADTGIDTEALSQKQVVFRTGTLIAEETLINNVAGMFDENTKILAIPEGYTYVEGDETLTRALIGSRGTALYIYGDLTMNEESEKVLSMLTGLHVEGDVVFKRGVPEAFYNINPTYRSIRSEEKTVISGLLKTIVDRMVIEQNPNGVCYDGILKVVIDESLTPEEIRDHLCFSGCCTISCTKEQESAVASVSHGVATIKGYSDKKKRSGKADEIHISVDTVNADVDAIGDIVSRFAGDDVAEKIRSGLSFLKDSKIVSTETFEM